MATGLHGPIGKTSTGAHLRDPRDGSVATVAAYNAGDDTVALTDGRRLPWSMWDRLELVR